MVYLPNQLGYNVIEWYKFKNLKIDSKLTRKIKMAKNQVKYKQHPLDQLLFFKNHSLF